MSCIVFANVSEVSLSWRLNVDWCGLCGNTTELLTGGTNPEDCMLMFCSLYLPVRSRVGKEQKLHNTTVHNEVKIRKYSLEQLLM